MNSPVYGTAAYNDFFTDQLTELLTKYGKIDEVWFDGANGEWPNGKKQIYDFDRWYRVIRKLQPQATIAVMGPDIRWVGTETGRGRETEWSVVPTDHLDPSLISTNSQNSIYFKPVGDMRGDVLGSREKIAGAKGLIWYPAETDVSIRPGWFYHEKENQKVKSPAELLEIYYTSVGRNSVLLVSIPPDTHGRINESDVNSLQGWKQLLTETFSNNLIKNSLIFEHQWDKYESDDRWLVCYLFYHQACRHYKTTITFNFDREKEFDVLMLQENITVGQRIEQFYLKYRSGASWIKATAGTTVGYKRLLRFKPVKTKSVRLAIQSSRLNPTISEVGLYKNAFPSAN